MFQSGSELEKLYQQEMTDFEADTGIKAEYSSVPFENLMDREMTLVGAGRAATSTSSAPTTRRSVASATRWCR